MIRYLKREEIDDKKWNGCVHFAINSFPYGYTWYLDNVAEFWDGLVYDDYQIVFPMVWNKKFGVYYLYQPFFTQQLGAFSLKPLSQPILKSLLEEIPERFKFIEINVNFLSKVVHPDFELTSRTNLYLDLQAPYEKLYKCYSDNTKRNLKKAERQELRLVNSVKPETIVEFFRTHVGNKIKALKDRHYHSLHRVIYKSLYHSMGQTYGVYGANNQLYATGFFLFGKNKVINLLPATGEEGKQCGAGFYLIDYIIRNHAGKPKTLDFEGSEIPSIARFYKGFGAEELNYWRLKRNHLPWYFKIFKK